MESNKNPAQQTANQESPSKTAGLKLCADAEQKPTIFGTADEFVEHINDVQELQQIMGPASGKIGEVLQYELLSCDDEYRTFQKGMPSWQVSQGQVSIAGFHIKIRPNNAGVLVVKATMVNKHGKLLEIERKIDIMPAEPIKKPEEPAPMKPPAEKTDQSPKIQDQVHASSKQTASRQELMIADGESTLEERKKQILLAQKKPAFLARAVELTEPTNNTDSWVGGGSYAAMYLAAESLNKGEYRNASIWFCFAVLMIIAKHCIKKGPLTELLESSGQKTRENIKRSLRGE